MSDKEIICPLPGIFYRSASPEQPRYKEPGDAIEPGDVIGLVEVMKSFHEVKAETSGVIDDFLIENESPVNAGQPIVRLK
ncbi:MULTISPECIES: acetyl-CoA carboxylase [Grimontia]|uniref:Biotin carboxyl carrier protein of acetyl-CoA carboxylase n=1 Tax=Grimontia marina TaxID=646534 RepID=A0A128FG51_9GAMM|nr:MULTISPECIES: acetyl-CoA carboxylase [Grimontia]WRW00782.1 acetyl-CoA carboxylase [Grimontia sp. NTOU-MAR1]CZF85787.1 Biotin carboxyl carrier protein of acetyl-CoA carboxylase [Grimontia marina]